MTIYLDVLYLVNCYVTALLLFSVRYLVQVYVPPARIFWTAVLGGSFSLLFLVTLPALLLLLIKVLLAGLLVFLAFGKRCFGKNYLCFLLVNALYGGILYALELMGFSSVLVVRNGIAYLPVSAGFLCMATLAIYGILWLYARFHFSTLSEEQFFQTRLSGNGETVTLKTLCDTGHQLTDAVSGLPVLICQAEDLRRLLSPADYTGLLALRPDGLSPPVKRRFQLVYAHAISGDCALPALRVENCWVQRQKRWQSRPAVVAFSRDPLSDGSYQAIAGPDF